jgi:hypothetical protein
MPQLDMGEINYKAFPRNLRQQYALRVAAEQRIYYWLMFFAGGGIFLLSSVM